MIIRLNKTLIYKGIVMNLLKSFQEIEKIKDKKKFNIIDEKFKANKLRYILQSLLASIVLALVLICLDTFIDFVIISAIGATTFILFAIPHKISSTPRRIIGGYVTAIMVGKILYFILQIIEISAHENLLTNIFGAISVGITIFLMVVLDTEHPPAVGVALVIIKHGYAWQTLLLIILGIILLIIMQRIFKKWLIDLE